MKKRISPYTIIILSFVGVVLLGTLCLALPFASTDGHSRGFVDSLFMSTSCVCVTGLTVVNVSVQISVFGKIVMALLMEIGGLSFITIAIFFFMVIGGKIGVSNKFLLREALNQSSVDGIGKLVIKIVIISVTIQLIGAFINLIPIMKIYEGDFWTSLGVSLFHSAASFNNAGFDTFGDSSLIPYADDLILNLTTISMIVIGGIGFVVIDDVVMHRRWSKFNLHTKITLCTTALLIIIGTLLIKFTDWDEMTWLQALFTSVTSRTAGFTTYNMADLTYHTATYVVIIVLMIIGASPCSTGGGIKTSTFAILMLSIVYFGRGKKVRAFKRKISDSLIFKAFVLLAIVFLIIFVGCFLVSIFQPELNYNFSI